MPKYNLHLPGGIRWVTASLAVCAVCRAFSADFIVTTTNDSGPGSFRQAILDANSLPGLDRISFNIGSGGARTITLASLLPAIVDPVIIDGTTQPGYSNHPLIEINGANLGTTPNPGLRLLAGNSVIRGLAVNRFAGDGLRIEGAGTNLVQANYIGTDSAGTIARGNGQEGVLIYSSFGNVVGGTNAADRNLISGNGDAGVYLLNGGANSVLGNYIGTSVSGANSLPNRNNGIAVYNSAANNLGRESAEGRNIVSGNLGSGIYVFGSSSASNVIVGNYIGTTPSGTLMLSNQADGITIVAAPRNVVPGNLISGNGKAGIFISGGATANVLQGNYIGCNAAGTNALGNFLSGVIISGSRSNLIGGPSPQARNLIAGNKEDGIFLTTNTTATMVQGNYLGIDASGARSIANGSNGITINCASSNVVGGLDVGSRNIISGNVGYGVLALNGASANSIQGNFIGANLSGTGSVGNGLSGIRVDSPSNTIGGDLAGAGNLISGNSQDGVWFVGSAASSNVVQANLIGLDKPGTGRLKNGRAGIGFSAAPDNLVGGPGPAANTISGNDDCGLYLIGFGCVGNRIQGNRIGTDITGMIGVGNAYEGVYAERSGTNFIGAAGTGLGNVISANLKRGLYLTNSPGNLIQGNFIGTTADGIGNLGHVFHAIDCEIGSSYNLIGGDGAAGNRIAFSQPPYCGVRIRAGATNNAILSNQIFSNGALGIDLGVAGVLPNDPCDSDIGANMQQNYPVLEGAWSSGHTLSISGYLNSAPNHQFQIQFFANALADSSGYGEGETYLGDLVVSTGPDCTAPFSGSFNAMVPEGYSISATATDEARNTSEFAKCVAVRAVPSLELESLPSGALSVSWSATATGFVLKQAATLNPPVAWSPVSTAPTVQNGRFVVIVAAPERSTYFLLFYQP